MLQLLFGARSFRKLCVLVKVTHELGFFKKAKRCRLNEGVGSKQVQKIEGVRIWEPSGKG